MPSGGAVNVLARDRAERAYTSTTGLTRPLGRHNRDLRAENSHEAFVIYHDGAGTALAAYYVFAENAEYRAAVHVEPTPPSDAEICAAP